MKSWFRVEVSKEDVTVADIYLYEVIGGWIDDIYRALGWDFGDKSAKVFLQEIANLPDSVKTLRLHINSPGGDCFSAATIANTLRDQKTSKGRRIEVLIEGLAASAATVIAMAGDEVEIADNALFMIHNPWSWIVGNAKDMRKCADELDKVRDSIVVTYKWHSSLGDDEIKALMDAETWMNADEAIERGFATKKTEGLKAAAMIDRRSVNGLNVPDKYRAHVDALVAPAPVQASAEDVIAAVSEAGLSADFAAELVRAKLPQDQVTARIEAKKAEKASADSREKEIRGLCKTAKLPALADGYVRSAMPVADVRTHLTTLKALQDGREINGGLPVDEPASHGWKNAFARAKRGSLTTH